MKAIKYPVTRKRRYHKIRGLLDDYEINYQEFADKLGKSTGYVSQRFSGERCFDIDEGYEILDMFGIPHDQFTEYFPKGGWAV